MKRFLAIQLETEGEFYYPVDFLPPHWKENRIQAEFAEAILMLALFGEETIKLSGVEIPLSQIVDFHLVERGIH